MFSIRSTEGTFFLTACASIDEFCFLVQSLFQPFSRDCFLACILMGMKDIEILVTDQ
jgi:hypothetical protein